MKPTPLLTIILQLLTAVVFAQIPTAPPLQAHFRNVTSHRTLSEYLSALAAKSNRVTYEIIGQSAEGRDIAALKFSSGEFGKDPAKLKVLIFAQQHGNEQSGKEGALLLAASLLAPENLHLFNRIDLALIPQMNPDGSEVNQRRNAAGADLNRNHLILTEPETQALHRFFDRYGFEATLDVHEYSPYSEEWRATGYRKNAEVTLGTTTNLYVAAAIRELSEKGYMPWFLNYLHERGFSSFVYCPGGPPGKAYFRHSTFDINDGRQSFGIQNSFSFIQEGMNGEDNYVENLERRSRGQMTGMMAFLEYLCNHHDSVRNLVHTRRASLMTAPTGEPIPVQMEHTGSGTVLRLPLFSYYSGKDTLVNVQDYRPVVRSILDVPLPLGYLIPAGHPELTAWVKRHDFLQMPAENLKKCAYEQYQINRVDSIDFEGDPVINPVVATIHLDELPAAGKYIFIPVHQLKGQMICLALEPQSMLGLATYPLFANLVTAGQPYPVLRVVQK